jgi:neuroblastoma suppressor of tumorigenicity 1
VTLSCQQSGPDFEQSQIIVKRVQIITNCSCSSCSAEQSPPSSGVNYASHLLVDDSDQRSAAQKNDLPDLLNQQFEASSNNDDYPVDASLEENNDVQQEHHLLANEIPQFHPTTSHQVRTENIKAMLNNRLISLLKNIQEKNSHYDKKELVELLKIIQGPDQTLSDKNIVDFVESLNSEHIELDIPR